MAKKKQNSDAKKPESAVVTGGGKEGANKTVLIASVLIGVLIVVGGAIMYFTVGGSSRTESIDEIVDQIAYIDDRGRQVWNSFQKGEYRLETAMKEIIGAYSETLQQCDQIRAIEPAGPIGKTEFLVRRRNAEDLCQATANFLFGLSTSVNFRIFGGIEEGAANQQVAVRLGKEVQDLQKNFAAGKPEPELSTPALPVKDDSEYVFVILMDAARADHFSAYGYDKQTTPNIDKLASEGVLFENAYSQCSTTDTSVASLMTGLYPRAHKMYSSTDWLWEYILVDHFRKAGFTTGGFSANTLIAKQYHFDNGFDYFEEVFWNRATITIGEAKRWIEKARTKNDKIFAYIHLIDPHDLYFAPPPFFDMYDKGQPLNVTAYALARLIENEFKKTGAINDACKYDPSLENWDRPELMLNCLSSLVKSMNLSMRDIQNLVARYDGEISYSDSEIGGFVKFLEQKGMLQNSTIVIVADHGESFMEHNAVKHGRVLYDNEIHVPFIIWRGKDKFGGRRIPGQVEIVDVFPTLFGMLGMEIPKGLHGRDLFNTKSKKDQETVYALSWNGLDVLTGKKKNKTSAREPQFKYIQTLVHRSKEVLRDEFYHLPSDPGETHDVRDVYPEDYKRLKEKMNFWNEATDIEGPRPVEEGIDPEKMQKLRDLGYIQ